MMNQISTQQLNVYQFNIWFPYLNQIFSISPKVKVCIIIIIFFNQNFRFLYDEIFLI